MCPSPSPSGFRARNGLPRPHEHRHPIPERSPRHLRCPGARLRRTHQTARHHAGGHDCVVRLLLRLFEVGHLVGLARAREHAAGRGTDLRRHRRPERGHGARRGRQHAPHRQPPAARRAHDPLARHHGRDADDRRRRVVPGYRPQCADRDARAGHGFRLSGRLHSAQESPSRLHVRWCLPRRDAGSAARGRVEWETLTLFAIVFFWQFPHFFSIAWLYREDYEAGRIRMLPVVEPDGRSTALRIIAYSLALIPVSLAPTFLGMSGRIYLCGALLMGAALLYTASRLTLLRAPISAPRSKQRARQLLQATVLYLPLLFVLMMLNGVSS